MSVFTAQKILFDLDGTLVNTAADLHAATNHVLTSIGREQVSLTQVQDMTGYGALRLIETGLEATGGTDGLDFDALRQKFLAYYTEHICVYSQPYPGCREMLDELATRRFQMAVCTNKPIKMANALLKELKIETYFGAVVGGDSLPYKKPDGRHLLATSNLLSGDGASVMVGDSEPDVLGAKSANIPIIAVDFGYSTTPIESHSPDHIVSSLNQVSAIITYG